MNNNCEYASGESCMCNICQATRKALEDAAKITKEEVDELFREAEKKLNELEER